MLFGLCFIGGFGNKPKEFQIKPIDKGIDYSVGVFLRNGIFQLARLKRL
jgi:hypothetical protein